MTLKAKERALDNWRDVRSLWQRQIKTPASTDPAAMFPGMFF